MNCCLCTEIVCFILFCPEIWLRNGKHEVANNYYGDSYATTSIVLQADPTLQSCIKAFNSYR